MSEALSPHGTVYTLYLAHLAMKRNGIQAQVSEQQHSPEGGVPAV